MIKMVMRNTQDEGAKLQRKIEKKVQTEIHGVTKDDDDDKDGDDDKDDDDKDGDDKDGDDTDGDDDKDGGDD